MYAETGLLFPYFQDSSSQVSHFDDFCSPQKPNSSVNKLVDSTQLEYAMTAESDLFQAPDAIIQDPLMDLDPFTAALMINCQQNIFESLETDPLLSQMLYECQKDLLEKSALDIAPSEFVDMKTIPLLPIHENESPCNVFQKSLSSECLSFMEFEEADYGMRRSFSEGDIKTLVNSIQMQPSTGFCNCSAEERREKLSRYRNKKTKRNFRRKIKYACRKALADNQPRIRGRFAKTEETDGTKKTVSQNNNRNRSS